MASERHLRLAELLAEGMDPTEACLLAGWPATTAAWLGPRAYEHLAKAGICVAEPASEEEPLPFAEIPTEHSYAECPPPDHEPEGPVFHPSDYKTKAEAVRAYSALHPDAAPAEVAEAVGCSESTARTNMK